MSEQAAQPDTTQQPPPQAILMQFAMGYWQSQGMYVAAKLGLADLIGDGTKTSDQLAAETKTHPRTLYRLMRALASIGIFAEDDEKRFSLTQLGQFLRTGKDSMRAGFLHWTENPSWAAWGNLDKSVETGETGFVLTWGEEIFPYYAKHPESNERFNDAMTNYSEAVSQAVLDFYDFSSAETIVDIGGGHGSLINLILQKNPQARGILFDQPAVIESAKKANENNPIERCELSGGDFFSEVPMGGDIYVMKAIIHDWGDDRSVKILQNVNKAMKDDGKLILVEAVVTNEGQNEVFSKWLDLHMLIMTGGMERTEAEYAQLLEKAGFRMTRVIPTPGLNQIVEAVKAKK